MRTDNYRARLFDNRNIFLALYSVHSYIFNQELLTHDDKIEFEALRDIFDKEKINHWVDRVHNRLSDIIDGDNFLRA